MLDYKAIGMRCGIEIHQQLDTAKLFCRCPTILRDDKPDFEVKRELKAVVGETGEKDIAALHEEKKAKYFIYESYNDTTCLIELDEEPPLPMNQDAVDIVLQVSSVLNAEVVDEIQIMRKTVVDGSNTTGFQRTALVSRNGFIETSKGKVTIPTITIEEESARIIEQKDDYVRYRLDRLGMPLIEIGTGVDIIDAEHCKETAEKIGEVLRSVGGIKRGLGTIRQDVNVSIKGGTRIEIKGAQDLKLIPKYVEYECLRQINLLKIKDELTGSVEEKKYNLTELMKNSECKVIKKYLGQKGAVTAIKLSGFRGFIGKELQPGKRLGTEFSDYAKVKAGVRGLFHSDELPNYGITEDEVLQIRNNLRLEDKDAFIMIADTEEKTLKALDAVIQRAKQCFIEIPKEVRKANDDGTSSFMRPLSGASRLYPETDVIPIKVESKNFKVELISEKIKRLSKEYDLNPNLAALIVKKNINLEDYAKYNLNPTFIAEFLIVMPKEIKTRFNIDVDSMKFADELLGKLASKEIKKEAVLEILTELGKGNVVNYSKYRTSDDEVEKILDNVILENKGANFQTLMGKAMEKLRGKIEGKKLAELIMKRI